MSPGRKRLNVYVYFAQSGQPNASVTLVTRPTSKMCSRVREVLQGIICPPPPTHRHCLTGSSWQEEQDRDTDVDSRHLLLSSCISLTCACSWRHFVVSRCWDGWLAESTVDTPDVMVETSSAPLAAPALLDGSSCHTHTHTHTTDTSIRSINQCKHLYRINQWKHLYSAIALVWRAVTSRPCYAVLATHPYTINQPEQLIQIEN